LDEQIAETLDRVPLRPGMLERITGVRERRLLRLLRIMRVRGRRVEVVTVTITLDQMQPDRDDVRAAVAALPQVRDYWLTIPIRTRCVWSSTTSTAKRR
jgi:hypothetical protein